ncbi:MAG: isoprenylcysteine carboxylmethyltransferase family protein [Spirochaetales bacterium]|nr:isoprenylcysteine carboxylmethyltransferase family protein [Spirochaetales bacterium]
MEFVDYFQLIFLFFFYVLFLGRSVFLLLNGGVQVFVLGKEKKGFSRLLEILFFILFLVWTIILSLKALHVPFGFFPSFLMIEFFNNRILEMTGIILDIAGIFIFIAALLSFGKSWRVGIDKKKPDKLITHGIFSITRNPIFLFMDLYFLGTWFIYSNLFFLLCSLIVFIGIHYQIGKEEEFLYSHYGKEYEKYTAEVRRYI